MQGGLPSRPTLSSRIRPPPHDRLQKPPAVDKRCITATRTKGAGFFGVPALAARQKAILLLSGPAHSGSSELSWNWFQSLRQEISGSRKLFKCRPHLARQSSFCGWLGEHARSRPCQSQRSFRHEHEPWQFCACLAASSRRGRRSYDAASRNSLTSTRMFSE
jgi:hypothetical protein